MKDALNAVNKNGGECYANEQLDTDLVSFFFIYGLTRLVGRLAPVGYVRTGLVGPGCLAIFSRLVAWLVPGGWPVGPVCWTGRPRSVCRLASVGWQASPLCMAGL